MGKKKTKLSAEEQAAQDKQSMEAAAALRARREAVQGEPAIDRDIHFSLPLTRVFVPLIVLTLVMYGVAQFGISSGNDTMVRVGSVASVLLFISAFVVWFVSRHQAKKLTQEMREQRDAQGGKK